MQHPRKTCLVRSIAFGALLEILIAVWMLSTFPKDSQQPSTPLQMLVGATQAPAAWVIFLFFGTGLGRQFEQLPQLLAMLWLLFCVASVVLVQSAAMGMPVWLAIQASRIIRAHFWIRGTTPK